MVGPTSSTDHARLLLRLKVGISVLVGASMALVAFQGGGSATVIVGAAVAGSILGAALTWYVFPDADAYRDPDDGSYRR